MNSITVQLDNKSFPILLFDGSIGISVSGGADSAILLYLLAKHKTDPIHVFTASLDSKNNTAPRFAQKVIERCIKLTNNSNIYHHVHFINNMNNKSNMFNGVRYFLKNNLINNVYTAETLLPPKEDFEKFKNQDQFIYKQRNPLRRKPHLRNKFYSPFISIDKKHIREMYEKYDVIDSLFPVTRSCESFILKKGHCGECLWCEERYWAFGRYE